MSVSNAGEGSSIALISVENPGGVGSTGKPNGVTGRLQRGRKLIGRQKTAVVTDGANRKKKRWMIHLQEDGRGVL